MKKTLPIVFLTLLLALTGCVSTGEESLPPSSENDSTPSEPTYKDFENVFFDSKTLIYDGEFHLYQILFYIRFFLIQKINV